MPLSRRCFASTASGLFAAMVFGASLGAGEGDDFDTSRWEVIFSDTFDRAEVGDLWKAAHGKWTVEDGALKGRLVKREDGANDSLYADIALSSPKLPSTVEVRYETWSPDELGSEAKFLDGADGGGIVMAFLGVEHPFFKAKGAMVFFQKVKNFKKSTDEGEAEFTPKVHHKVRLLRKEDSLALFLDGKLAVAADITDAKGLRDLKLHLMGTWGKEGSVIYFDNLEIRVPTDPGK